MNLSTHFTLAELTKTNSRVENTPSQDMVDKLILLADRLEGVRDVLGGVPILVSSGYRSPQVNALVGGAPNSQHTKGEAADFIAPAFGSPYRVCAMIIASNIDFDQLIYERTWVHCSFATAMRRDVLTIRTGSKTYLPGLVK